MWYIRSHVLQPLTTLTPNKVKFKCTDVEHEAFDDIKCIVAHETLVSYPDFSKRFDIHTYARDLQLGAVIIQGVKKIVLYSRKMILPQTQYR